MAAKEAVLDTAEKTLETSKVVATKAAKKAAEADTHKALENIEKTLDVIEDQIETIERIPKLRLNGTTRRQQIVILTTTAVVGAAVGSAVTYFVTGKRLHHKYRTEFEALLETEVEEMRVHYARIHKKDEFATPESAAEEIETANEILEENEYSASASEKPTTEGSQLIAQAKEVVTPAPVVQNLWDQQSVVVIGEDDDDDDWDQDDEEKYRNGLHEDMPYIISEDEYLEGQLDYDQQSLTYFEGDKVLIDGNDQPIEKVDKTVGPGNLRFGHGSKNKNIVYIRNNRLELEFEVHRSEGKYVEEVLGFGDETALKHSNDSRMRRFHRGFDD